MMQSVDWDRTWIGVADAVALRSRCVRSQIGAVIVTATNQIIATGYNGPPSGLPMPDSCDGWCPRTQYDGVCYAVHAEANALLFCGRQQREGGTCYVIGDICWECAKLLANSGLKRVVVRSDGAVHRNPERGIEFMRRSGLIVEMFT